MKPTILFATAICFAASAAAQTASIGSGPGQDVADALRTFANTDGAFIASGHVKDKFDRSNLATILKFPSDEVMVLDLTGEQILKAFERSVSLYPQTNQSFLQVSGFEIKFDAKAVPNKRILTVTASGVPLVETKTYTVAMPSSLARGTLGYFKIWDKSKISKTFKDKTIEDVVRGKAVTTSASRWSAQ